MKNAKTLLAFLLAIGFTCYSCKRTLPDRPNILFIMTDYQAGEDIPDETEVLQMPNLDRLSKEGIIFRNHICTAPVCMPSRYTVISGRYPHYTGMKDNANKWLPEGTPTLMEELGKRGYHTAGIGKMHFYPWDRMAGYDVRITADRKGNWHGDSAYNDDYQKYLKDAGYTRWDYLKLQDSGEIFGLYNWPLADSFHIDYFVGEQAADYLKTIDQGKPWFVWVSFNGPHNPWDPPEKYSEYYLDKALPEARWKEGELAEHPVDITRTRYNYTRKVVDHIDVNPDKRKEYIHKIRAGHYGNLTFIDEQFGKIMASLEESHQLDNTIIIWTADHGSHLGDHNLIHKGTHYDRSARVPFVVWWGKHIKKGERSGFSAHVDLMQTFLDLAGGTGPPQLEGHSLKQMIAGESEGDDHAFVEILGNYSILTHSFIYGVFPMSGEKVLIDKTIDPDEHRNVIRDTAYQSIADSLENILYDFHPDIESEYNAVSALPDLPGSKSFEHLEVYFGNDLPYLGGKAFTITTEFNFRPGFTGPLYVFHEGRSHGISSFIKDGKIYCGFRTFGKDQLECIMEDLPSGHHALSVTLDPDGIVATDLNGITVKRFKSLWPMPVQSGNPYYLTGTWFIGRAGAAWMNPIGTYENNSTYTGTINQVHIELNN